MIDHTAYVYMKHRQNNTAQTAAVQTCPYAVHCTDHLQVTTLLIAVWQYPSSTAKGFVVLQKAMASNNVTFIPNVWEQQFLGEEI